MLLQQEANRPHENLHAPLFSVYNPLGERDHPRPDLACKMIWVGYELLKDALTTEEIELLNRCQPGDYRVTKADGQSIPFNISGKFTDSGKKERLMFHFPCKDAERHNHEPMHVYLREVLGEKVTLSSLHHQIDQLKAQLATQAQA